MPPVPHPGVSEVGWLADLKQIAEQVGSQAYGEAIRWDVEGLASGTARRPDVVIRRDSTAEVLASGEAKRPDTPQGSHPLIASEVQDAIEKAQILNAPLCFTTNFFEAAVFNASTNTAYAHDLDRLQGKVIPIVPLTAATTAGWWTATSLADREQLVVLGLRKLFDRLYAAATQPISRDINEVVLLVFARTTDRLVTPLFEEAVAERDTTGLPGSLVSHSIQVHLNPTQDADLHYLVAQGVAEVLTATLFYRNLADHFSLPPLLAGTWPANATLLSRRIERSFGHAIHESGDYEPIFQLSPAGKWVLCHGSTPVLQQWRDLFAFVEALDFTQVSSDVIGTIFERLISPERRHAMGQHYTDPRIAQAMSRWAVRSRDEYSADIGCGAGTFLVEMYKSTVAHGASHEHALQHVMGNDLDPFAVHLATVNLATRDIHHGANYPAVRLGDAFDIRPGDEVIKVIPAVGSHVVVNWPQEGLDVVLGNPPYAKSPDDEEVARVGIVGAGGRVPVGMNGGNLAAWFALLAAGLLKEDGRWGLVLPTGVLQNSNLAAWRTWLRSKFDVIVWHTEDDVWFSDARVATCAILATPKAGQTGTLHFVDARGTSDGDLHSAAGTPVPTAASIVRDLTAFDAEDDILVAGIYPDELRAFADRPATSEVAGLRRVEVFSGNKLGHAMFQLRDRGANSRGVLRDLEGHQMNVRLNRQYLKPLLRSPVDERTGEFTGSDYWVLHAPEQLPSTGALRSYINRCRELGVHLKASVRQRGAKWWHVNWRSSQIALQIHPGFLHQVWWSDEPFVAKNNFHVLVFEGDVPQAHRELIAASMASGFGALASLTISSEVGNEGVRWLSTPQLDRWPVLDPDAVSREKREAVLSGYRLFRRLTAQEIHEMDAATMSAWQDLTAAVAEAAGLTQPQEAATETIEVARRICVRRAAREAMALAGRTRGGSSGTGALTKHLQERLEQSSAALTIVNGLTAGDAVVRLRPAEDLAQGALDLGEGGQQVDVRIEEGLARVLGAGFECAPHVPGDAETFANEIQELLDGMVADLIGAPPPGGSASHTHATFAAEIHRVTVDWLQERVDERLL